MYVLCPHCHNPIEVVKITPREEIACSACGSTFCLETDVTTGSEGSAGWKVGRFDLIETVGQGGFGTVYKARDPELDRIVAVKVPRSGNLAGPQELDRFLREARSIAQLRHPSIVSVYEVGESGGVPYLVSDFVRGVTLADLLTGRQMAFHEAADLVATVAEALHYAHERGVVHRDVKPSNIMIGEDGRPCVMDFGLARRETGEITMTVEGQVLGTPAYMSPEQARGEGHTADGRSDVYSLSVVLYQLLTGELPFRGTKAMVLHQVEHDEPRPPRGLNDHIPRDLETITLKAMAKESQRRYATARDMADDLRRWLNGEPIRARPAGRPERALRWARRRPAAAALLLVSGIAALALVGLGVGWEFNGRLQESYESEKKAHADAEAARQDAATERDQKDEALQKLAKAQEELDWKAYVHAIFLADGALKENNVLLARQRLQECKPGLQSWEWHHLDAQCHAALLSCPGNDSAFSPDGSQIAAAGEDGVVRVYELRTGRAVLTLKAPQGLGGPTFAPDGQRIATGGHDGVVRVYDTRTGREALSIKGPVPLFMPAYSPDGSRIAVAAAGEVGDGVRLYDARTGQEALTLKGNYPGYVPLFSPDGSRIAVLHKIGDHDQVTRLYDTRKGEEVFVLKCDWAVFSPDGGRIATVQGLGDIGVYDARTGREAFTLKGPVQDKPVFSPDGARIAFGGQDGVVRVYDAESGAEVLVINEHPVKVHYPMFSPDGATLAVGGENGVVRLYDARTGQQGLTLKAPHYLVGTPAFSPDGERLLAWGDDGLFRVYDVRAAQQPTVLKAPYQLVEKLAPFGQTALTPTFSPDGRRIAATDDDGAVMVFDVRTGQEAFTLKATQRLGRPVFSPDGERIAAGRGYDGGEVGIYDARTGQEIRVLKGLPPHGELVLVSPVFSPDGGRLGARVGGTADALYRVYDTRTWREAFQLKHQSTMWDPVFTPGGEYVVAASDEALRVYDARTGQEVLAIRGLVPASAPVISPDGARVAVVPTHPTDNGLLQLDGVVRVYDFRTGQETVTLEGPLSLPALAFSPDGARIAADPGGEVRLYDARTGKKVLALKGPPTIGPPAFSPDGTRIAARSRDEMVRLFDARTGQEVLALKGPPTIDSPVFSRDGTRIAVGCSDGLRVWTAPNDTAAWQAERRLALADGLTGWHRARADEAERAGDWFALAFHLRRLSAAEPASGLHHYRRGVALTHLARVAEADEEFESALALRKDLPEPLQAEACARLGRWDEAARLFEKAAQTPNAPQPAIWLRQATLRLRQGDQDGYRKLCAAMIDQFGNSTGAAAANDVAMTCALGPQALPDLKPAIDLARTAVRAKPKEATIRNTLGAVLYRAGQYQEAVTELNGAVKLKDKGGTWDDYLFLAMAHLRLGKADEARAWLDKAVQAREKNPPLFWTERLLWQLLHREAEEMLKEAPPNPKE